MLRPFHTWPNSLSDAIGDALQADQASSQIHKNEVDKLVQPIMGGKWTVGLVVGLVSSKGQEFYVYGKTAAGGAAPDGDTLFEVGSITKTFTSLALASMIKDGTVTLLQPVKDLLPASKVTVPAFGGKEINLLQLSTHVSGLPRMPTNIAPKDPMNPYVDYTTSNLYTFLNGYTLPRAPGAKWEYSNLATGLLGHALSLKAGKTFEALVAARITQPLKMSDTAIKLSAAQAKRFTQGHDYDLVATKAWDFDVLAPCGAIRSTARDMLTYLSAQAGITNTSLAGAMAETHKTHFAGPPEMGLAWFHTGPYTWHNGGTYGFETFAGFDSKTKTGVVVLSNSLTAWQPQTKLGLALLAMMAGQAYSPVDIPALITVAAAILDKYAGTYKTATSSITIQRMGDALYLLTTGQPAYRMYARSSEAFYLRAAKVGLTFIKDSKGKYSSLEYSTSSGKVTFTRVP